MSRFITANRNTDYLLPPSVDEWLPEGHLARFVVEVVEHLDLSILTRQYAGRGSAAHHPSVLLGLLIYGYATGTFSSRKIERATYDSLAFRYVAGNTHPDHDTLATFRRRFLSEIEALFVQVLLLAKTMNVLKLGQIALDGSKVKANASKHKALSYGRIKQLEQQLREEVSALTARAEAADQESVSDGMDIPAEIARRDDRLAALAQAKEELEARAAERDSDAQSAYESKIAARQAQRDTGKKPRGREPKPPVPGPNDKDQINLTDEESRIMPVSGGGFDQCFNVQNGVDTDSLLIVTTHVTQAPNDKQQIEPALEKLVALPGDLGEVTELLADTGYFSRTNVEACRKAEVNPLIAMKREAHHQDVFARFAPDAPAPQSDDPVEQMAHRLSTQAGRAIYGRRKQTVETVFGIIKSVLGFRQFSLRGLASVAGEWSLVAMAWNIKRMNVLRIA